MPNSEEVEKARQAIMRLRELLDLMRETLDEGERAYEQLFAGLTAEEMASLKEKDRQGRAALDVVADPSSLRKAALGLRFGARNLERDFEQLHDNTFTE